MPKFYLKDWHGKEQEFTDDKIFVRGEDGELIQFTQGEGDIPAVVQPLEVTESGTYTAPDGVDGYSPVTVNIPAAETTVQPDFADGDMEVLPGDGELLSKVTIQKPETLIPENIADGIDIAGIIGTGGCKVAAGSFTGNGGIYTLKHGLGVMPDVFILRCNVVGTAARVGHGWGVSSNAKNKSGFIAYGAVYRHESNGTYSSTNPPSGIEDTTTGTYRLLTNANATSIDIGNSTYPTWSGKTYYWFAIGGLT